MSISQNRFTAFDHDAVKAAQLIPMQVVQNKGNGHAGTAMALAPLAHVLFSHILRHNPRNPHWAGRDRFVLSAGHASLLLYVQQYLTGYGLTLDDIAKARAFGSLTPGHPEYRHTPGVEMTTGPLGQGVASAVGMALAAKHEQALFGASNSIWDHTIWVLAGDGCLQEGVSAEASSLAGTLGLDNLVLIWDDNNITIDSTTSETFSEDVRTRYLAYGWRILEIPDATDLENIAEVLEQARTRSEKPTLVVLKSIIGHPSPNRAGTSAAHAGPFGQDELAATKRFLGAYPEAPLEELISNETLEYTRQMRQRGDAQEACWQERLNLWENMHPEAAALRKRLYNADHTELWLETVDALLAEKANWPDSMATRNANQKVLRALHKSPAQHHGLWGGSADLASSTNVSVEGSPFSKICPEGSFIRFGIREHAMIAILNGIALHSPWRPYGSTYLTFSDYTRPALRLSALMELGIIAIFTHDSVAVGEDGPTHQPIEHLASLRSMVGLDVVRPADATETIAVWKRIATSVQKPIALILSRQDLPILPTVDNICDKVASGAYVMFQHGAGDKAALLATGSEVSMALKAAHILADEGIAVRLISVPCTTWFDEQDEDYREEVLPSTIKNRVAVEAGVPDTWWKYVGSFGQIIGINRYGISGSPGEVMASMGITVNAIVQAVHQGRVQQ